MSEEQILITGASGFIGTRLRQALKEMGISFQALSDSCDLRVSLPPLTNNQNRTVFHLAGITPQTGKNAESIFYDNLQITSNLIKALTQYGAGRVIYANTNSYGQLRYMPIDEKHPLQFNSLYHLSKYLGEQKLGDYGRATNTQILSLRLFNIYGEGQKEPFLIPLIINSIENGKSIKLNNPQDQRDYLHISDVIRAFILAYRWKGKKSEVFNIAFGSSQSNLSVAQKIMDIMKKNVPISITRTKNKEDKYLVDIKKAQTILSWTPKLSLEQGIRKILNKETASSFIY